MNVLIATAPVAAFNHTLHYRYTDVGEVLGYLRRQRPAWQIRFADAICYQIEWSVLRQICAGVDVLILFCDVASAPATLRLAQLARQVAPGIRIVAYGKGPLRIPAYFQRHPFDAVHTGGDQEVALLSALATLAGEHRPICGLWLAATGERYPGRWLPPAEWSFPALADLPLDDYRRLAVQKAVPFELSVYPSRGCRHTECRYCDAWLHEGVVDRRRDPDALLAWIEAAVGAHGFACVQLHSAQLCADAGWVRRLCDCYRSRRCSFAWTCCTRLDTLAEDLLGAMARAGCRRVGVGVENLPYGGDRCLKAPLERLEATAAWARRHGVAIKAYIMAGLPRQTELDLLHTYVTCLRLGWLPRVSAYTPFHRLSRLSAAELDALDLSRYDRKSFLPADYAARATALRLLVRPPGVEQWAERRYAELQESAR